MPNTQFINLTPHDVTYVARDIHGGIIDQKVFKASGVVARVSTQQDLPDLYIAQGDTESGLIEDTDFATITIPVTKQIFKQPENVPPPVENTLYIVSSIVKSACTDRPDLIVPTDLVRDKSGNIIGCAGFYR